MNVLSRMSQQDNTVFINEDIDFQKKGTHRFFLHAPLEATWAGKLEGLLGCGPPTYNTAVPNHSTCNV